MAGEEEVLPSFHDTYVSILQQLEVLRRIHLMHKSASDSSSKIISEVAKSEQPTSSHSVTDIAVNRNQSCPTAAVVSRCNASFRKRKRKQESDKICRVDLVKAEDDNLLDSLKADECQQFFKHFSEELPNLVPKDASVKESISLNEKLEVCKTLASLAGRFIGEKNFLLEEEYNRVRHLEHALSEEHRLKEELRSELVVLEDGLAAVLSATDEGRKSDCLYCSSTFGELGKQENQNIGGMVLKLPKIEEIASSEAAVVSDTKVLPESKSSTDHALEEGLASDSAVMYSKALPLQPLKMELDDPNQEIKRNAKGSGIEPKSCGLSKANGRSPNNKVYMESKSSSVFSEFQQSHNVTGIHLQREVKDNVAEMIQYDGKDIDNKKNHADVGLGIECSNGVGNGIEEEDGAVESKESQPKSLTVNAIELDGSTEDSDATGLYDSKDLTSLSELKEGHEFIEMKCGCTSPKQIDTLGTLRVYDSGVFEIYCECMMGCDKGKPMTPASFERHGGRGANRKWKHSIWILVGDQKLQLSKAKILEPYYQKYKAMKTMRITKTGVTGQAYHRDRFIPCTKFHKKPKHKWRKKEDHRILHDALGNTTWQYSNMPHDREDEKFLNSRKGDNLKKRNVCYNLRSR